MKPFNQFVQVLRSIIFLFIRYKHYKMFGTNATNEKGLPADPCRGDSGKESSQTQWTTTGRKSWERRCGEASGGVRGGEGERGGNYKGKWGRGGNNE